MRSLRFLLTAAVMLASSTAFAAPPHIYHPHIYTPHIYHSPAYTHSGDGNGFNYGGYGTATYGYGYYNGRIIPFYSQTYPVHPWNPWRPFDMGYYGW